jgi:hypothetical protein
VWQGAAPLVDTFGLHFETHTAMLTIDGDTWTLRQGDETTSGALTLLRSARSQRRIVLEIPGSRRTSLDEPEYEDVEVTLLLLELDPSMVLVIPAPIGQMASEAREPSDDMHHAQLPEGAGLLWHILKKWPRTAWPAPLRNRANEVLKLPEESAPRRRSTSPTHRSSP